MEQEQDPWAVSQKALNIIFIIIISLVNILVIARQVRKKRFYGNPKLMTVISLAVGDIILALFPLVVLTVLNFNQDPTLFTCGLDLSVSTYMDNFIHFVYCAGLILLGMEVFFRQTIKSRLNEWVVPIAAAGLPWVSGLIIVLPLSLANMDFEKCISAVSLDSITIVSVLVPATLTLITLVIIFCIHLHSYPHVQTTESRESLFIPNVAGSNYVNCAVILPKGQGGSKLATGLPCAIENKSTASGYVNIVAHSNDQGETQTSNGRKELQRLLVIAAVFVVMVIPYTGVTMSLRQDMWLLPQTEAIVTQVLGWWMVARSVVTPIIMLTFADL